MFGKSKLLETLAQGNRGIGLSRSDRQTILAQVIQLEERNPTPEPTAALSLLQGDWRLVYTTSAELLGLDRFPGITLGAIYQCIRLNQQRVFNIAEIQGIPLLEGMVSVMAKFDAVSPQRLSVQFQRSVVGFQRLLNYQSPSQFITAFEAQIDNQQRFLGLDFDIQSSDRSGWIDITYLDTNLRINRGNEGSLFVLVKE